jgi:hypothetical protein
LFPLQSDISGVSHTVGAFSFPAFAPRLSLCYLRESSLWPPLR